MDFNVYKDIEKRTNGEIYIGVVGPVRTGKSTFIKNFMDIAVVPNIKDENEVRRTMDELPQSSAGKCREMCPGYRPGRRSWRCRR